MSILLQNKDSKKCFFCSDAIKEPFGSPFNKQFLKTQFFSTILKIKINLSPTIKNLLCNGEVLCEITDSEEPLFLRVYQYSMKAYIWQKHTQS